MRPSVRILCAHTFASLAILTAPVGPGMIQAAAQSFPSDDPVIRAIWQEGVERSQVYELGQVMMDSIGPRLTGSPGMALANDWAVAKYAEWGIEVEKEQYGTWRGGGSAISTSSRRGCGHSKAWRPRGVPRHRGRSRQRW